MSALTAFLSDYDSYYDLYALKTNTNQRQAEEREQELRKLHGLMDLFTIAGKTEAYSTALTYYQSMLTLLEVPISNAEWLVTAPDIRQYFGSSLFRQISTRTIANTTVETSLFSGVDGSQTFPANFMEANWMAKFCAAGFISGINGNTATIRIKLGNTTLVTSTLAMPATIVGVEFVAEYSLSCRTAGVNGTVIGQGYTMISAGVGQNTAYFRPLLMTTTAAVDTTIANLLDITYQWSVANTGNSLTLTHASFCPLK